MSRGSVTFQNVSYLYETGTEPVFVGVSAEFPAGWTGIIGANGAGKTTLLRLACKEFEPTRGRVLSTGRTIYCPQRTDEPPADLPEFLGASDAVACGLRGHVRINPDWAGRWSSLSHGERKRAQISVALWSAPDILAIDEPTNHIDRDARQMLAEALQAFRGAGLLVSHDRELLDRLCERCLFLESHGAAIRPGGYSKAVELSLADAQRARTTYYQNKRELTRLEREAADRKHDAAQQDKKRSKGKRAKGDSDGRAKIDLARVSGKDGAAGRKLRQMQGRVEQVKQSLGGKRLPKKITLGIELCGATADRNSLADLPEGDLALGSGRVLHFPELRIGPRDRIGLIGENGSGKSTLLRQIMRTLALPPDKVVYLPQEIDREESARTIQAVRALPRQQRGQVMTVISCLNSRA